MSEKASFKDRQTPNSNDIRPGIQDHEQGSSHIITGPSDPSNHLVDLNHNPSGHTSSVAQLCFLRFNSSHGHYCSLPASASQHKPWEGNSLATLQAVKDPQWTAGETWAGTHAHAIILSLLLKLSGGMQRRLLHLACISLTVITFVPGPAHCRSDKDQRIVVSQPAAGVLYDLVLRAKVRVHAAAVWTINLHLCHGATLTNQLQ
jgi:hypothetical protein